jgi:hypothetical protein
MTLLALEVGGTRLNTSPVVFSRMRVRPARSGVWGRGGRLLIPGGGAIHKEPLQHSNGLLTLPCGTSAEQEASLPPTHRRMQ